LKEQSEANTVIEALLAVGIFPGIKYILELKGINCNGCRKPMKRFLSEEEKRSIDKILPLICL
jgi:dihydrodipicolinate synthase/N-acetylneuraminate lyase